MGGPLFGGLCSQTDLNDGQGGGRLATNLPSACYSLHLLSLPWQQVPLGFLVSSLLRSYLSVRIVLSVFPSFLLVLFLFLIMWFHSF